MEKQKINYYLGLDIGIGSVGWAIIGEENGKSWLEDFGVRLFNAPEDPQNKKSLAEKRRELRGKRRLLNRWHCRREDLTDYFLTLFGEEVKKDFQQFSQKATNSLEYDKKRFFSPYVVRHQALDNKIELAELLNILLHCSKYRGYRSFYLDDNPEEKNTDNEKIKVAINKVRKLFQENNYRSIAEMVVKNEKFRHSRDKNLLSAHNHSPTKDYQNKEEIKKNDKLFIFPRELLEQEIEKILQKQSEYYPQLKRISSYRLWKNGKLETKEYPIWQIIKGIIFRQRDFEDGPTKTEPWGKEEKLISHWKKHNRNIASASFEETTGYCQYFPEEKRGWRCSLVYSFFQFINEFSKLGRLETKELGEEKVKQIHQQVFNWLLFTYQPTILSKEEKSSGKKRETFRKQLEKFLDELIGKENYSFPKGIEFKTEFLDILKEDKGFYSVLWKSCPPEFYLNYENYQKTIFYQIGEIIFKDISPWRRKEQLNNLAKKHGLEPFQICLDKLEIFKERSPASVSFHYMIETINAFLNGEKYGDFQAKSKQNLEEKILENRKISNEKEKLWAPWMHPDLVRNPVVFRSFNQTRKILRNLFLSYPSGFATINIETGRDSWNSEEERNKIERKNQDQNREKEKIVQKLKDNNSNIPVNETNIKKYRLWEDQNEKLWIGKKRRNKPTIAETNSGGICLYCEKEIDIYNLKDTEIDYIIPQSKWANDSFNNLTLTHLECNQAKGESLPFHFFLKNKTDKEWSSFKRTVDNLYKTRNSFKHKFFTLGDKEGWERELEDFVSRNLNDTRMVATYLVRYVQNELKKDEKFQVTKVQSIVLWNLALSSSK